MVNVLLSSDKTLFRQHLYFYFVLKWNVGLVSGLSGLRDLYLASLYDGRPNEEEYKQGVSTNFKF